jgi:Flp pilus assembly pilin Flp
MQRSALAFIYDESGAAAVDWVFISAGIVAALLAAFSVVSGGANNITSDMGQQLANIEVGSPPGGLPWAGPQSGTAAAEGDGSGVGFGNASGAGDGLDTGLGTGGSTTGGSTTGDAGDTGTDDDAVTLSELEELMARLDADVLVVDPAAAIDAAVTDLLQDAVDGATASLQILTEREIWLGRVGNPSYPEAADVVAAFDQALLNNGIAPPV